MSIIGKLDILTLNQSLERCDLPYYIPLQNSDLEFGTSNIKKVGVRIFLTTDAFSRKTDPKGIKPGSSRLHTGSHAQHLLRRLAPLGRCHVPYRVLHKIDDFLV